MHAKVEIIDPAFAKLLLGKNARNRPVSATTVQRYASDMKAGRWNNNGQGIIITPESELLDGQHRLHAVILSQASIAMLVVRGVSKETFATMDSGKSRTLGDVLAIEGHNHANTLAAAARLAYNYASGNQVDSNPTKATLEAFVNEHQYGVDAAGLVHGDKSKFPRAAFAAVIWLGNEHRNLDEEARSFVEGVFYGEGLFKGDARHTLREWMSAQKALPRATLTQRLAFGAIARAWNAYAAGKELLMLKGIHQPTLANIKIYGFDRRSYPDVPDIPARVIEVRRSNLARNRRPNPIKFGVPEAEAV